MLYSLLYHIPMGNLKLSKRVAIVFLIASFIYVFIHSFLFSKEHSIFFLQTLSQYFYLILGIDIIGSIAIHKLTNKEEEENKNNLLKKNSTDDFYSSIYRSTEDGNEMMSEFPTEENTKNKPMKFVKMEGNDIIEG